MRAWILTIAVSIATASPALARRGGRGGGGFNPVRIEAVAAQLGVSDATLAKIKNLAFKAEQEAISIKADVNREHLALRQLMDAESPDESAVMKQIDKAMAQEARMRKNRVALLLEVRKLLTPEQRTQLQQLMWQRRGRGAGMGGGAGMGPGMGGGAGMGPGMGGGRGMAPGMGRGGWGPDMRGPGFRGGKRGKGRF